MWKYQTIRYYNRFDIVFRINAVEGIIEMQVDDNLAQVNGYYNLEHLKMEIAKLMQKLDVPKWIRIDNCCSPALTSLNLN